ncbi:MAG TPA: ABC transporter ATP-binding protein [Roseiarcus sp.]|nr:ABC transporter ATP-binding protein [Roseiarcus sp.]
MRIVATKATVRFGEQSALEGVDCAVGSGEMVALIGPNGAGKTTLMRVLADLQPLQAGEARYDGRRASELGRGELAKRVAFLAQGGTAYWPLRVDHLVGLGRLPHRRAFAAPSAADHAAIEAALAAADVAHLRARSLGALSGGERARALLARALAVEAEILLADEPVAALDPLHQLRTMELLRSVASRGAGVVVVLHDLTLAVRFCDRLIVLAGGRVVADGPPSVLTEAVIAAAYGVDALRGEYRGEPFIVPWAASESPPAAPPGKAGA